MNSTHYNATVKTLSMEKDLLFNPNSFYRKLEMVILVVNTAKSIVK